MKDTVDVTVRTRPKYSTFIIAGVILGFIAAVILMLLPVDTSKLPQQYSTSSVLGALLAFLGIVGGFLGAIAALIVERVTSSRTKVYTVGAQYEQVQAEAQPEPTPAGAESAATGTESGDAAAAETGAATARSGDAAGTQSGDAAAPAAGTSAPGEPPHNPDGGPDTPPEKTVEQ